MSLGIENNDGPAIRAFVVARIQSIAIRAGDVNNGLFFRGGLEELNMVLALCDGLAKQNAAMSAACAKAIFLVQRKFYENEHNDSGTE